MNLVKNLIISLCLTLNLSETPRLSVRPSIYLMPETVFTNQANIDRIRKTKIPRINPPAISLFRGKNQKNKAKAFQISMPLPDLESVFLIHIRKVDPGINVIRNWKIENQSKEEKSVIHYNNTLAGS